MSAKWGGMKRGGLTTPSCASAVSTLMSSSTVRVFTSTGYVPPPPEPAPAPEPERELADSSDREIMVKNIEYKPMDINLTDFLNDRINFFEVISQANDKTIDAHIAQDIWINMNDTELERLIDNNLSNAIKHSYDKSTIEVHLEKHNTEIILKFISSGEKIKDTTLIFDKNYTETQSAKRSLGLGLSMVKTICEKNCTHYYAHSEEGRNTFTYIFKG